MFEYTPPPFAWPYVIAAAVLLLLFLLCARRGGWPVLLIAVAIQPAPPDPQLVARMDSPISSTVSWTADRRLCLSYSGAFAECRPPGRNVVTFGHSGSLSGDLRPAANGVYVLSDPVTGASWQARARWWRWLAEVRA